MGLHQTSGQWRLGFLLALATILLWGILPIALKVVLEALDVYTVTWFRFLVSFSLLWVFLALQQQLPSRQKLQAAGPGLLAIATSFLAINYLCYLLGLKFTTPATSQVIIQLAPVCFSLGALLIFRERYNWLQCLGLGTLILGMSLFFNDQLTQLTHASCAYLFGSTLIVLAAITWAVYALAQKQLLVYLTSPQIMLVIYGGSTLLFTPMASPHSILTLNMFQMGMLLFSALNTLLAYGAFAEALAHWEASRVSAVLSSTPIITLIAAYTIAWLAPGLVEPERLTMLGFFGAWLVVMGSLAIALGKRPPAVPVPLSTP